MLFKIVFELLLERKYLPRKTNKKLVDSVCPTIVIIVIRSIILLPKEIVQDPSVLFSMCKQIDLQLPFIENRPTLL